MRTNLSAAPLETLHNELALVHELISKTIHYRSEPGPIPDTIHPQAYKKTDVYQDGHWEHYKKLLSFRKQIWDIVNKLPYASNEQLGLDKLSHEIYPEIFSHIVDHYPVGCNDVFLHGQSDAVTIAKALRLTNRRLHDLATLYLMSRVDVEITKASIERLENIARHPVIGPFIRQIRFRLPFGVDLGDKRSSTPDIKKRTLANDDILRLISAPLPWGADKKYLKRPRTADNTRVMNNILVALGSEGVRIRDLFIDVFEPWRFENLRSYPAAEKAIGRLTETLEGFRFQVRSHENDWPQREVSDLADLRSFTDSLLRSRKLRAISLNLKGLCPWNLKPPESPSWHINMLLTPREWPELRQLTLNHVLIHSSKLDLFLGQRKEEMSLALVKCSVSFGTWREALDVMRDAVPGGLKVVAIRDCAGAEYDHFRKHTGSETHYQGLLFGSATCHSAYGTWNSGPKFTDGMSLCYITHRTETHQCDPAHPLWKHTDAAENPFRVAKLSEEVRNSFDFEPQL
ncbi:hypothetical protein CMUS01_16537 [Colletotrichum musicola]|uniref:Uncharacterized protein n=1 Tax=Colletotrichum musicola TaxID=2175873 RepID=A0A8H6IMZ5_9PEZI|nr:hypothetical protein CMUS01_16537 [Colletotrichum musicola]